MQRIIPYVTQEEALLKLDNGGRFYNFLTKADDGVISKEELGKVGGLFYGKQQMILFLELSISHLQEAEQDAIIDKLDNEMKSNYQLHKAKRLLPSEAQIKGELASNTIITGVPRLVESKEDFNGFIIVPIVAGNVTTFTLIPLIDQYDVYEVRDEQSDEFCLIAHAKWDIKLPEQQMQIAGVLKELKDPEEKNGTSKKFLEATYWLA